MKMYGFLPRHCIYHIYQRFKKNVVRRNYILNTVEKLKHMSDIIRNTNNQVAYNQNYDNDITVNVYRAKLVIEI